MVFALAQPVLADIGEVLLGLVAVIFLVIRQILEANKQAGPRRPRVPQMPQPQPGNKPPAPPAAGQQADPLRAQVEEFLRRASRPPQPGQQAPKQPQPAQQAGPQAPGQQRPPQLPTRSAPPSEIEILVDPQQPAEHRTIGQPLKQAEWRKKPAPTPTAPPQSAPAIDKPRPRTAKRRQSVAEHVAEQVTARARSLASKASQLGQRIATEDQQFDVQLKAKFDHTVGTLTDSATPAATQQLPPANDSPAAQLASMLANPGGIRQAILLNEILRRPSERW